jgi:hypothetical protein
MKLLSRSTATGLLALGISLGVGSAAFAVDDPGPVTPAPSEALPPNSKGRCEGAIMRRVVHLATWKARLNTRTNLTVDEKAALSAQLDTVSSGLITVALPAVQRAKTKAELRAACQAVTQNYRVYLVVHPQVFITAAAQGWQHRIDELQEKAAALKAAGKKTDTIDALLASYNADPAGTKILFNTAKGQLETVRHDVRAAAKLIRHLSK